MPLVLLPYTSPAPALTTPRLRPWDPPISPCALGTQTPLAVLGLPSIKVTPRANLNTALRFFHPPRGLLVNPPLELRPELLWAQDLDPLGPALPQQAPVSGWAWLAPTPDLSPQGDGQRACIFS